VHKKKKKLESPKYFFMKSRLFHFFFKLTLCKTISKQATFKASGVIHTTKCSFMRVSSQALSQVTTAIPASMSISNSNTHAKMQMHNEHT
jgi:hypothetical protein